MYKRMYRHTFLFNVELYSDDKLYIVKLSRVILLDSVPYNYNEIGIGFPARGGYIIGLPPVPAPGMIIDLHFIKHSSNDTKCKELYWVCVPLVVESYGAWGKEALESISQLASRLATCSSKTVSGSYRTLYGRLNLHLVRANAIASLSRR